MDQPLDPAGEAHEGAERHQLGHLAAQHLPHLDAVGELLEGVGLHRPQGESGPQVPRVELEELARHPLPDVDDLRCVVERHEHPERFFRWSRLQRPPETDIVPELQGQAAYAHAVLDKVWYSLFTDEAVTLVAEAGWTDLVFCGIATESCVLKSAADAFERGYAPWVLTDASASDAGSAVHDAGLTVARRVIGPRQLITTEDLLAQLPATPEVPVLE